MTQDCYYDKAILGYITEIYLETTVNCTETVGKTENQQDDHKAELVI